MDGDGVGSTNGEGNDDGQYPEHWKLEAAPTSTVVSSQVVLPVQVTEHPPDPQEIIVFPLQASDPLHVISTSVASDASNSAFSWHALFPLHIIAHELPVLQVIVLSTQAVVPSQLIDFYVMKTILLDCNINT